MTAAAAQAALISWRAAREERRKLRSVKCRQHEGGVSVVGAFSLMGAVW